MTHWQLANPVKCVQLASLALDAGLMSCLDRVQDGCEPMADGIMMLRNMQVQEISEY